MELVMLKEEEIDKKGLLASLEAKKQQEQQEEENGCDVVVYDPKPQEVVDSVVLEKLAERKKAKIEKLKGEAIEREKLKNALALTNVSATIKEAGFYPDGSPKVAIAGLFDDDVEFIVRDGHAKYCSDSLSVILADVKNDWKNLIIFFVGLACVIASEVIAITTSLEDLDFYSRMILFIVGMFIPLVTLIFVAVPTAPKYGSYFTYIMLPDIGKVRTKSNFYTKVPEIPESILAKITGKGPFAILFEVTKGWRKVKPDPVILRVINIKGKQLFEPVLGYNMTQLEKSSLTEA